MPGAWAKLPKSILTNGLLNHPKAVTVFNWLLLKAAWADGPYASQYGVIDLKRGQVVVGRMYLASQLPFTEREIRTCLQLLAKMKITTSQTTSHYSIITIVEYDPIETDKSQTSGPATKQRPSGDQATPTDKEVRSKEVKNKDNTLSADAESGAAKAPKPKEPHIEMRNYWHAEFEKRFNRKAAFIPAKWLADAEKSLLDQIGMTEAKNRTHNCLEDGYKTNPRYVDFLKNNEDFATLRRFVIRGDPNEYKSKRGTFDPGAAKGMLSSLASNFTAPKPPAPKQFNIPVAHTCRFIVKEDIIEGRQAYACTGCYRREFEDSLSANDRETLGLPLH